MLNYLFGYYEIGILQVYIKFIVVIANCYWPSDIINMCNRQMGYNRYCRHNS